LRLFVLDDDRADSKDLASLRLLSCRMDVLKYD
jgi:hypothetical protein